MAFALNGVGACLQERTLLNANLICIWIRLMIITKDKLDSIRTAKGGYTGEQVRLGKAITGKSKWVTALVGSDVSDAAWESLKQAGKITSKNKHKAVNKISLNTGDDWSWKPNDKDIPALKHTGGKNSRKREKINKLDNARFYTSNAWKKLRYRLFEKYEFKCMACSESPQSHGIVIYASHIKPRSRHPELSLTFDNLQLLCEACDTGRGSKYESDLRPDDLDDINETLDRGIKWN